MELLRVMKEMDVREKMIGTRVLEIERRRRGLREVWSFSDQGVSIPYPSDALGWVPGRVEIGSGSG